MNTGKRNIVLNDDSDMTVIRGGIKVEFNAGGVTIYTNGNVKVRPADNDDRCDSARADTPRIGDRMTDGTIFAGTSPETGKPMFTTSADAPLAMNWKDAMHYAARLDVHGHKDWRLPSRAELKVLFSNRAAIGGFDESGSSPAGYYWSSVEDVNGVACGQRFSDGNQYGSFTKFNGLSVRCVR